MSQLRIDPIRRERTIGDGGGIASSREVVAILATVEVADLPERVIPYLAAATAEAAFVAGVRWRFVADTAPVALLRMLSRAALRTPTATGPHLQRLFEELDRLGYGVP